LIGAMPEDDEPRSEDEESEEEEEEEKETGKADVKADAKADDKVPFDPPARVAKDDEAESEKKEEKPKPKPFSVPFRPHTEDPPMEAAVIVEYCPIDGLPPDFCQYGPSWEKSKPWCLEHYPQYYPELSGVSLEDAKKVAEAAEDKSKEKLLPGGKKKREASPRVTIKKLSRGGRKCVTTVTGLDGFGVKLDAAAKLFKKKFACGSSVVKGDNGQPDFIEIQGDFEEEVIDVVQGEYKDVERKKFIIAEGGTKKKGKSK